MDYLYIVLADLVLSACRKNQVRTDENPNPNKDVMFVTCTDTLTGKTHSKVMTDDELSSVVACAISNNGEGNADQYAIAAKAIEDFPNECRPIP